MFLENILSYKNTRTVTNRYTILILILDLYFLHVTYQIFILYEYKYLYFYYTLFKVNYNSLLVSQLICVVSKFLIRSLDPENF